MLEQLLALCIKEPHATGTSTRIMTEMVETFNTLFQSSEFKFKSRASVEVHGFRRVRRLQITIDPEDHITEVMALRIVALFLIGSLCRATTVSKVNTLLNKYGSRYRYVTYEDSVFVGIWGPKGQIPFEIPQ